MFLSLRKLRLTALFFGGLSCWLNRFQMNGDVFAQFEMADAVARGDWALVPNGHWSPLFPFLTGGLLKILRPTAFWEYPVHHLACAIAFGISLAAFDFFLRTLSASRILGGPSEKDGGRLGLEPAGAGAFLFVSVVWILSFYSGADLLAAAFIYLTAGTLLQVRERGVFQKRQIVFLGFCLGFAYLSKMAMALIGFLFCAVFLLTSKDPKRFARSVLGACLMAAAVMLPWAGWLSMSKGRLTLGDAAAENYAGSIHGVVLPISDDRAPADSGRFKHPLRRIYEEPELYEFGQPMRVTYPPWYDSSYWLEGGLPGGLDLRKQAEVIALWTGYTVQLIFLKNFPGVLLLILGAYLLGFRRREAAAALRKTAFLWVPSLAGIGIFLLVHVQGRYLAPFVVILWGICWKIFLELAEPGERRLAQAMSYSVAAVLGLGVLFSLLDQARHVPVSYGAKTYWGAADGLKDIFLRPQGHVYWQIAQEAKALWLEPGDQIAGVGDATALAHWARLARVRITAQVPPRAAESFCDLEAGALGPIDGVLRDHGIQAVVSLDPKCSEPSQGWIRIGNSDFRMRKLEAGGV